MRLLANETFPGSAVEELQAAAHDVVWVRTAAPGVVDPDVLAWAAREERILPTFDKDFGEFARGTALPVARGVLLLRMRMHKPENVGQHMARLVLARTDWAGHFSVIEPGRVRMRSTF